MSEDILGAVGNTAPQSNVSGISAHYLDDTASLVRGRGILNFINSLHCSVHCGIEADGVLSTCNIQNIIQKIFGTHSQNELKRVYPIADAVMALDEDMQKLSDEELKAKTKEFKERLENGETLDDILPEAYAVVREAASRVLGMKHYRVQIVGGIILHQGRIAEMRTGEGKTLVATLPSYLNALEGKGVHVVTVNDYLAKRDAEWMGQVHEFLGLTVGVVLNSMDNDERRAAYECDITYVTNNELGFDYLRDNMVIYKEQLVQRGLNYALIDEVDSVLIDEARTPLIISGQSEKSTKLYEACDILARQLERGDVLFGHLFLLPVLLMVFFPFLP